MGDAASTGVTAENILGDDAEFISADSGGDQAPKPETTDQPPAEPTPSETPEEEREAGTIKGLDWGGVEQALLGDEDDAADDPGEDDPLSDEELKDASPRAQQRIRELSAWKRQSLAEKQQIQQWAKQAYDERRELVSYAQNMERTNQDLREKLAQLTARVDTIREMRGASANQEPKSDIDVFQNATIQKALEQANQAYDPRIKQLTDKISTLENSLQERERKAESAARSQRISVAVDQAVDQLLYPEGYPEEIKSRTRHHLGNLVIAHSYAKHITPEQGAQEMRQFLRDYIRGILRAGAGSTGAKIANSRNVTPPSPKSSADSKPKDIITQEQAEKLGHRDSLEAAMAIHGFVGGEP